MNNRLFSITGNIAHDWMVAIFIMMCGNALYSYTKIWHVLLAFVFVSFMYVVLPLFSGIATRKKYAFPSIIIFRLLLLCSIVIMLRGVIDAGVGYQGFLSLFPRPKTFMPFLFVFLVGCSAFSFDYKNFIRLSIICTVVFGALILFFLPTLVNNSIESAQDMYIFTTEYENDLNTLIAFFSAPLVLFLQRNILPKKVWSIAFVNIMLALFLATINARRSTTFGITLVLLIGTITDKKLRWVSIVSILIVGYYMYTHHYLDFMLTKLLVNTRDGLHTGFYADMDTISWIFGRGATGTYFDSNATFLDQTGTRTEIETGYLNMILKGGILYLVIYVISLLYAAWKGLRQSNNSFVRSFAIIILVSLLELIPYGIPTWNLKFYSIWMGVVFCLDPNVRNMSDQEIKALFKLD